MAILSWESSYFISKPVASLGEISEFSVSMLGLSYPLFASDA